MAGHLVCHHLQILNRLILHYCLFYVCIKDDWKKKELKLCDIKEAALSDLNAQYVWRTVYQFNEALRVQVDKARVNNEVS